VLPSEGSVDTSGEGGKPCYAALFIRLSWSDLISSSLAYSELSALTKF